jgi:predicted transcriptional regulator
LPSVAVPWFNTDWYYQALPMLTVKLDPKLKARVRSLAAALGVSTSELVRQALQQRLAGAKAARRGTVHDATRDLCGIAEASDPGLSARRMSTLIRERHARKGSR